MTNFEKIRTLSDDELTKFLVKKIYTTDDGSEGFLCSDGTIFNDFNDDAEIKAIQHELEWLK